MSNKNKNQNGKSKMIAEQEANDWFLAQRILAAAGLLETEKVAYLDEKVPGWNTEVADNEFSHALLVDHPELNHALEQYWNAEGMSPSPMTFAQIRAKAMAEM
jgi:hypothetical protein